MSHDEHLTVVREVIRAARKRVPVVAGTGSNSTAEAIRLTRGAEELGADGALLISPYYNKPTQDGIVAHYTAIAEATRIPLIVYNIQGRTASNITAETMARLAEVPRIVGVKEASGSMAQVVEILDACGPDFAVWAGDDVITLPLMAAGGVGVISVTSNVAPARMVELTDAMRAGDLPRARRANARLMPLFRDLFLRRTRPREDRARDHGRCTTSPPAAHPDDGEAPRHAGDDAPGARLCLVPSASSCAAPPAAWAA
jgi:4-hydroxy-tetrahydrodipicolinate synthase